MEKVSIARKLLEEKVKNVRFEDEVYTLVSDIVLALVCNVEVEIGDIDDDNDDERWYDNIHQDMMDILYERIGKWLTEK